ncbi:HIT family protein [Blattabacterium sp. (Cryptocercus kyebangensis)]|uniref:HIT family protein n=1 Tax=Blattabacterium sp. (Cryptocercus kyebangensis) TaxID=298656 RepID=UPI000D7C6EB9|nr:HIT domain-containing protein [Blattabacterium sp. (Cryptocercus kyebangensis)]AWU43590.1 HIT family protein [Blattabacterium sp. (Cryptocercus kyebangensis)]
MNRDIFTKIIKNEISAYKIAENSDHLAILDIYPVKIGHTLVIPKKKNVEKIFSLTEKEFISIMSFTRKVAIGLEKIIPCNRIGIFVLGFEIPHVHIHLIPMDEESDGDFSKRRIDLSEKCFKILSNKIRKSIEI